MVWVLSDGQVDGSCSPTLGPQVPLRILKTLTSIKLSKVKVMFCKRSVVFPVNDISPYF